jgi:hypothetical protein
VLIRARQEIGLKPTLPVMASQTICDDSRVEAAQVRRAVGVENRSCNVKSFHLQLRLSSKHLCQNREDFRLGLFINPAELFNQASLIYSANLVKDNPAPFPLKFARHSCGIGDAFGRHWRDNNCPDEAVHFIRRDD